jgi:protein MpaA
MALIDQFEPTRIVSVHIPLETVNYDGPARTLAERMAHHNGYPVKADIGYPTPGSFGTYAGKERGLPVITLELPAASLEEVWPSNRDALDEALRFE